MHELNQADTVGIPKRRAQRIFTWLGRSIIVIVGLILIGIVYESRSEATDAKRYPPPGRFVDVGGYQLHLYCSGEGSPTVVIESGWGGSSAIWGWVQPEVAKITRVCAYDRAGMGWSESSPEPRTARQFSRELHILLERAHEPGPYVLVGHSLGGHIVRVYANEYVSEVAGLVLVDPQNLSEHATTAPNSGSRPGKYSLPVLAAHMGLIRLLAVPLGAVQDLPPHDKQAYKATSVSPRSVHTFLDEGVGMSEGAVQARAVTTLGDMPLILLSRGKNLDDETMASQDRYLNLSSNSLRLVAEKSDHGIMVEQPDSVVDAIMQMVEMVR